MVHSSEEKYSRTVRESVRVAMWMSELSLANIGLDRQNHNRYLCRFLRWFSGVAEDPTGPVADGIGARQNGFPVRVDPLAGIDTGLGGQNQKNGGVLGQGNGELQESGNGQQSDQDEKREAWHGFGVSGACEVSSTDQHGQCRAKRFKAQQGARTISQVVAAP